MSKKLIAGAGVVASLAVALAPLATFATGSYYPNTHKDTLNVTIEEVCSFGHDYAGTANDVNPGAHVDGTGLNNETGTQADTPTSGHTAGKSYGKWELASGAAGASAYDTQDTTDQENPVPSADPRTGHTTALEDTAYGIMETNTVNNNFAKTTLAIICNTDAGYQIKVSNSEGTASMESLRRGSEDSDPIAFNGTYAMDGSTASAWNFMVADTTTTGTVATTGMAASTAANANSDDSGAIEIGKGAFTTGMPANNIIASQNAATSTTGDRLTVTYGVSIDANQGAGTYAGSIVYTLIQL